MKRSYFQALAALLLFFWMSPVAFTQFSAAPGAPSVEKGDSVSLELKGMDIVEVLKMLATKGNINIVIGSTVQGKVTMFLKNVNVQEAFDVVLAAGNLAVEKRGSLVYVIPQKEYELLYGNRYGEEKETGIFQLEFAKATEIGKTLEQIKTKIGKLIIDKDTNTLVLIDTPRAVSQAEKLIREIDHPAVTKVFELKYAVAKDLQDTIEDMVTKEVGTVQIDERTNKIIVTDSKQKIDEVARTIEAFDEKGLQVLIDAKIIEITLDDAYKLGVDWQEVFKAFHKEINLKNAFKVATSGALVPGGELLIGSFGNGEFAAMIQALKTVGDANTLSNPKVAALNNQEAKILIGTNQPYATNTVTQGTSTTSTATSLTFLDIGVKLYVTPTINKDGFISMRLRPEVSAQSGTYTYGDPPTTVPIVSTTNAETNVMVKDGTTIMIAGLIKDERTSTVNQVPFFGKIPILGLAFRNTVSEIKKKELVIFLTPHILSPEVDYLSSEPGKPVGDKLFTIDEWPTFDTRKPVPMLPRYLNEKLLKEGKTPAHGLSEEEYFKLIRDQILEEVAIPAEAKKILQKGEKVKVAFTIYAGGTLVRKPEVTGSENAAFREAVRTAVEKAAPFPPLPLSIKGTTKHFVMEIFYEPQ